MGKSVYFGFNPPFIGGKQNVLSRQEDLRLVKNDVIQLLLTLPGERVHRETFGTLIRSSVFEPGDDVLITLLQDNITTTIAREEPRLSNVVVSISLQKDTYTMKITVSGNLTNDPNALFQLELKQPTTATVASKQDMSNQQQTQSGPLTSGLSK